MANNTESISHKTFIILGSGLVVGVGIAGAVYFHRIVQAGGAGSISVGAANAMMILNIIIAIVAGIIFLWTIIRILFKPKSHHTEYQRIPAGQVPVSRTSHISGELAPTYSSNNIDEAGLAEIVTMQNLYE